MKRFKPNGQHIKDLRENRERNSTQKEFAHEVRISERQLRQIENENREIPSDLLDRIAKALSVPRNAIVFSLDSPRLVSVSGDANSEKCEPHNASAATTVPRFDTAIASVARDESTLLSDAKNSAILVSHILTRLNSDTEAYTEEMLNLLRAVTWEKRDMLVPLEGQEELGLRRRLRELLVLLKGNDVWVYATTHIKSLPESYVVVEDRRSRDIQMQLVIAFGPPGEYGEDTIHVPVDHGQPWIYDPNSLPF